MDHRCTKAEPQSVPPGLAGHPLGAKLGSTHHGQEEEHAEPDALPLAHGCADVDAHEEEHKELEPAAGGAGKNK